MTIDDFNRQQQAGMTNAFNEGPGYGRGLASLLGGLGCGIFDPMGMVGIRRASPEPTTTPIIQDRTAWDGKPFLIPTDKPLRLCWFLALAVAAMVAVWFYARVV